MKKLSNTKATLSVAYKKACTYHCVKSFQIESFFSSQYGKIRTRKNSVYVLKCETWRSCNLVCFLVLKTLEKMSDAKPLVTLNICVASVCRYPGYRGCIRQIFLFQKFLKYFLSVIINDLEASFMKFISIWEAYRKRIFYEAYI